MTIIAAMTADRVVGKNNRMPWHISEEFKHFRKTTMGHALVMGRKTFESVGGKPLPKRYNIVVSRSMPKTDGVDVCRTFDEAVEKAKSYGVETFIGGGVEIYKQALPIADRMILSYVAGHYDGDAYFPLFDESGWLVVKEEIHPEFRVVYYVRKV